MMAGGSAALSVPRFWAPLGMRVAAGAWKSGLRSGPHAGAPSYGGVHFLPGAFIMESDAALPVRYDGLP